MKTNRRNFIKIAGMSGSGMVTGGMTFLNNEMMSKVDNKKMKDSMNFNWTFNANDVKMAKQLSLFLPEKIFDIHAHVYRVPELNLSAPGIESEGPSEVSIDVWRNHLLKYFMEKGIHGGLFFPNPTPKIDIKQENAYLLSQLQRETSCRGLVLVTPDIIPEELSALLNQPGIVGMKPYHYYSREHPTLESSIRGFFPEWLWEIANEQKSVVMLHIVKDKAIADPDNLREIREMCTRYPHIKLILAHVARSFHSPHAKEGIKKLRDIENLWFDTSCICEPEAIMVVLREFGPRKLMWGSDFPFSQIRGKCVTLGDGFVWLDNSFCDWEKATFANPFLFGIESLIALQSATDELGLTAEDRNDIFYYNATRLLLLENVK